MKGQGAGGEKMAILGDVLSLATPKGITIVVGTSWLLWVSRSLKNAFAQLRT